jgi:hypothetical protein
MTQPQLLATASLAALFAGTTLISLLAFEAGLRLGKWSRAQPDPEPQLSSRMIISGVLSLLAFILGFAFHVGVSHFDMRNQALRNEAIAIGTAYRRADLISEPERTELRDLLREYLDVRLQGPRSENINEVIERLRQLQDRMWTVTMTAANRGSPMPIVLQSVNDVIDVAGERVLANMQERISFGVWTVLGGITMIAVAAAGYHSGLTGARRRTFSGLAYALVFAGMIAMIADVDIPKFGLAQVYDRPLIDLRARLTR